MHRTEAHIVINRRAEQVFAWITDVPRWHLWHWDWKWEYVVSEGDGNPGTCYRSTLDVTVRDSGSALLETIDMAVDIADVGYSSTDDGSWTPEHEGPHARFHVDTYHPKLAVVTAKDAPWKVSFSLPWNLVDVSESFVLEEVDSACRVTCTEERGDPSVKGRFPAITVPGARRRTIDAGLRRLQGYLR